MSTLANLTRGVKEDLIKAGKKALDTVAKEETRRKFVDEATEDSVALWVGAVLGCLALLGGGGAGGRYLYARR